MPANHRASYLEANARERLAGLFSADQFTEWMAPSARVVSPHLAQLDLPCALDDGVIVGHGMLAAKQVFAAAQEGGFMGGAVGEVHGAKLVGMLQRAVIEQPDAVLLLLESGGVRLHEANAGLIAVSEVMRAILAARAADIPVIVLIGGSNGCFGGMGIAARCANAIVMSEQGRLAMSGPEVIETANGVEEFDARDRALVWRTTGGKHRYMLGDCDVIVADEIGAFRSAAIDLIARFESETVSLTLDALETEQRILAQRLRLHAGAVEPMTIWRNLGVAEPSEVAMLEADAFMLQAAPWRARSVE